jgi:hypothetical protein
VSARCERAVCLSKLAAAAALAGRFWLDRQGPRRVCARRL